ncbi:hypothetical protein Misp01_76450 [Microtetraspora sp. NBRC 13810]|uniref:hypothetical protein n=1 Tax=Microtetraspora sp. NBRC 13810 TaxID=3030990 RepID=UPI0024A3B18E|nr:hypothetical protein [Microtetraspora sp. NBRC 13810]GLW12517.1 hypothetical protein Misp01_76450 [Microtetraspora sp. NBRC 13810]
MSRSYYRPVPDGAVPLTIWHDELDEDSRHWLVMATRDVEKLHPATMTHLHEDRVTTLALLPPVAPGTVEAAVQAVARWSVAWRVTPTWRPEPAHVRVQEIARQEREVELLAEASEIAQGWKHVSITSPPRPGPADREAFAADVDVRQRIYRAATRTGMMRRLSKHRDRTVVAFGHHEHNPVDAVVVFLAEVEQFLPAGWTIGGDGR